LSSEPVERRLTAILAADVAGYSRLIGADEEGTLAQLKAFRKTLVDPTIAKHRGRIVKTTGDGMLVEFASAVDAARCAVEVQRGMADENTEIPQAKRIEFRIGIHLGDIIIDDNDIFGDGVNIAARLESIAVPGGISISRAVHDQVRDRINVCFDDKGEIALKNIARPVQVFAISGAKESKTTVSPESKPALALPDKPRPSRQSRMAGADRSNANEFATRTLAQVRPMRSDRGRSGPGSRRRDESGRLSRVRCRRWHR
jgi:adenylate cyclase